MLCGAFRVLSRARVCPRGSCTYEVWQEPGLVTGHAMVFKNDLDSRLATLFSNTVCLKASRRSVWTSKKKKSISHKSPLHSSSSLGVNM